MAPDEQRHLAIRAAFLLIGFTAVVVQVVLMRELIVVFYGNELSLGLILACWLLWTSAGSAMPVIFARSGRGAARLVAVLQLGTAAVLPLTLVAVRSARAFFQATAGELLGPGPMLLTSLVALGGFCLLSGWLFAAGSRLYALHTASSTAASTARVYLFETVGSAVGGLAASLVLIRYLNATQTLALIALLNVVAAGWFAFVSKRARIVAGVASAAMFAFVVFPLAMPRLEAWSRARLWRGFHVLAARNSVHGNLVVTQSEGSRSLFENGVILGAVPDEAGAEEAVHYALLQHPRPRTLLLIGGGTNGSVAQALAHPGLARLDYVELDPEIVNIAREYLGGIASDSRVHIHNTDGRLFVKTAAAKWDVIIVSLPDPQTAQLNRFYTVEFFREVARRLEPGGVFSFRVSASENYLSAPLADFLRCLHATLRPVFSHVVFLPGETFHFFAAAEDGAITADPAVLVERMRARSLRTQYVREYYLLFRMMPERMREVARQIEPDAATPVNSDLAPVAYYFDVALSSARFHPRGGPWLLALWRVPFGGLFAAAAALLLGVVLALHFRGRGRAPARAAAALCVAAMGFTFMGLELLLLLAFQSIHGYVYQQLALLIAAFMAGCAAGSWLGLRRAARSDTPPMNTKEHRVESGNTGLRSPGNAGGEALVRLAVLQAAAAAAPVLLALLFSLLTRVNSPAALSFTAQALFPLLAASCGALAGYQFPLASAIFTPGNAERGTPSRPGTLYALDLAGACTAALLLSVYLLPVFGLLRASLFMALVNLAPAVAVLDAARAGRRRA